VNPFPGIIQGEGTNRTSVDRSDSSRSATFPNSRTACRMQRPGRIAGSDASTRICCAFENRE
jgi:hypothetical protein